MRAKPLLDAELSVACDLARQAGRAILEVRQEAMASSQTKADASPVTKADLAADAIIRAGLTRFGDPVVTEESWPGTSPIGENRRAWFVDPLDGTEDFVAGRPDYVVQIGLAVDGAPALGVLFQPATGILWRGVVQQRRCERVDPDGRVRALSVAERPLGVPRVALSISHPSAVVDFVVDELGGRAVPRGSVGLKVGLIVDDEADAYVTASRRIKVWDTCAPGAVLLAAGGVVTSLSGRPLSYTGEAGHDDGALMWTPAARDALSARVDAAVQRYRREGADRR
jgi:3'(2'), 5'-bisphosphate nucleotidase